MNGAAVTYFLADVHLSPERPDITAAFSETLAALSRDGSAVYILGDLFDYWLGDDLATPFHAEIAAIIAALPCPVFYQHGNRDFLLGAVFAAQAGMTILPERQVIQLGGQAVLLEHGDLLCTDDVGYQRLRKIVRQRWLQRVFAGLPRGLKSHFARQLRAQSKARQARKAAHVIDTNRAEMVRVMAHFGVQTLIHGHTHRPAVHDLGDGKTVFVLGDWRPEAKLLRHSAAGGFQVIDSQ